MTNEIPHCPHRQPKDIDLSLIMACDKIEQSFGQPLVFTSGVRCKECNSTAGGATFSAHLLGQAADILMIGSTARMTFIKAALSCGFRRIGIGKDFVHVDVSKILPQDVIWTY